MATLAELQRALDMLGVAWWFQHLPDDARHWEKRPIVFTTMAVFRLTAHALDKGATAAQIDDCRLYAKKLAMTGKTPLTLAGRSWDQFAYDVEEYLT